MFFLICILVLSEYESLRLVGKSDKVEDLKDFSFPNVTRHNDQILYLAYYFPQWHLVPENKLQDGSLYTDWDAVKAIPHSFTPPDYYDLAGTQAHMTLARQDELAHKHRVGGFIFWHYWNDNTMNMNHPVELFMQKARKTKFMLDWDCESGYIGETRFDMPEKHAYQLLRYFQHENYLTDKDGRKPFLMYHTNVPSSYLDKFTTFLKLYGVDIKIGYHYQGGKQDAHRVPANAGFSAEYGPHSHSRTAGYTITSCPSPDHWQGVLTSWDARPRSCFSSRSKHSCKESVKVDVKLFEERLLTAKNNIQPNNKDRIITIASWNEWSEGGVLEPSLEFKSTFLEALR